MFKSMHKLYKDERGITALETAIILIAFVVVAAVFAFTVLSAGTFLTERSEEAAYAGLEEVRGSLERKGDVVAYEGATSDTVGKVTFKVALVAGGEPVDVTSGSNAVIHMSYRDANQEVDLNNVSAWSVSFPVGDSDTILEENELAKVTVCLDSSATDCTGDADLDGANTELGTGQTFNIEVIPPSGAVLNIERTTPAAIDTVEILN